MASDTHYHCATATARGLPVSDTDYFEKHVRLPDIETQRLLFKGECKLK